MKPAYKIGLDIGSTTIKVVVLDEKEEIAFSHYERHNARIREKLLGVLSAIRQQTGDVPVSLHLTGSVGMGIAERCQLPFTQEVVAATNYIRQKHMRGLGDAILCARSFIDDEPFAVLLGDDVVYNETKRLLTDQHAYDTMSNAVNPYGDGKAAQRIVQAILHDFGGEETLMKEFSL